MPLNLDDLQIYPIFNFQHYKPNEGYYAWHFERTNLKSSHRILTWMFYLNDIKYGGGTEFYHQNYIEKAQQGKMVIFSSEYIHTHRGETAPFKDKYILTGWYSFKQ